jgi:cellulose synthase/poly-beta-1,6-N-acetylglucosamine synthase-like glycosyltransferase
LKKKRISYDKESSYVPFVTFIVAAYNESDCIEKKITNSLSLNYPPGHVEYLFITDGSTDGTNAIIGKHPEITLLHQTQRSGKTAALNPMPKESIGNTNLY